METGGRKDRSTFSVAIVAGDHMDTSLKRSPQQEEKVSCPQPELAAFLL